MALNRKQEDAKYLKQKIPGIQLHEINEAILCFQKASNKFSGVRAEKIKGAKNCFYIK